jgi:hypothetical protein
LAAEGSMPSFMLIGSRDGDNMQPHLIPLALIVWLFIG